MQSLRQIKEIRCSVADRCSSKEDHFASESSTASSADSVGEKPSDIVTVSFEESDPLNPQNWSFARKWTTIGIVGTTGFAVGWASSIDSAVTKQAMKEFGVSEVTESLATGLFLIAFGVGSLVSGPLSETVGRNPTYLITLTLFMIFVMASALSPNIGAQLAFRFIAGFCGCTPLTTFGGSMADMFDPLARTYVFPVCASLSFLGPFLAPLVGSFIGQSGIDWRWTEWTTLILTGVITISVALFVPETYGPIILAWKAKSLREVTGDTRYRAEIELRQISFPKKLLRNACRPFEMFFKEIMVTLFSLYLAIVYVVLFGFLVGYNFIFGDTYELSQGQVGLTFLGMNIGFLVAFAIVPAIYWHYSRKVRQAERLRMNLDPEQRLWFAMLGAPWLPISIFWMGWTAYPSIPIWSALAGSITFGFAVQGIFISTYQYLIDTYEKYAASALVIATLLRYICAGFMQVVSIPMFENLGVHWSLTLLGCLSVIMTPVPYIFYIYGPRIRAKSEASASQVSS